jgi:hypothetical protein
MQCILFQCSKLLSADYDMDRHFLEIFFRDGMACRYLDIPSTIFFSLLNAYSPDTYFDEKINSIFDFIKIK